MSDTDAQVATKLPLIETVIEAFELTTANLKDLAKLMWVWVTILICVQVLTYWFLWPYELASRDDPSAISLLPFLIPTVTSTLIGTSIAVGWHRLLLTNEAVDSSANIRLDSYVRRYFLCALALFAFLFLPIILSIEFMAMYPADTDSGEELSELLGFLGVVLIGCLIWFVTPRIALVLPAIALGRTASLRGVWKRTHGNTWRVFMGTLLTTLPIFVVILAAFTFMGFNIEPATRAAFILENCFIEVLGLLAGMFSVSFLSVAYRHFFGPLNTSSTTT